MAYRALLLALVLLSAAASQALAWSGPFNESWNSKFAGAEFQQSYDDSGCPTTRIVEIWTGTQVVFLATDPQNKRFSWAQVYVYTVDCGGYRNDEIQLYADLTKKPANKKDVFELGEFVEDGSLRIHMPMVDLYGASHVVRINMTFQGGTPYLFTTAMSDFGKIWEYGVFYTYFTAKASLTIDNRLILKDVLSEPYAYGQEATYVASPTN